VRTKNIRNDLALVAILASGCWGCTIKSGGDPGAGGDMGSGGATGAAGAMGSGGATGAAGAMSSGGATGAAGAMGSGGAAGCGPAVPSPAAMGPGGSPGSTMGPCDIYAADGGPCVAAHSTVRALYGSYSGPLYQVRKADCTPADIGVLAPGGFADSAAQDAFCGSSACTISMIYDQSGRGNHLTKAPAGMAKKTPDNEANAKAVAITISGHKVYGIHIVPGIGYRNNSATGTAVNDDPETEYMVVAGDVFNGGCCFDYGNMERNSSDNGEGTMEAVYFGTCTIWGKGADNGPWVMGDLENGLWAGSSSPFTGNKPVTWKFVTGMVKGGAAGSNTWTIKEADATSGRLIVPFTGPRPSSAYNPMRKEGAIGLGTGGDNSNGAQGNWFEGVMTAAHSSDAADDAVQANIVSAYGQ
jgi:non-reducing end alpha-L-arabinofuranosidase